MSFDINSFRAITTLVLFIAFVALCVFTWSKRRRADFDAAARVPLQDDDSPAASKSAHT